MAGLWKTYDQTKARYQYHKEKAAKDIGDAKENLSDNSQYSKTIDNQQFLVYQSPPEEIQKTIIFMSSTGCEILKKSKQWGLDGSFKCAPKPYKQVITIHAVIEQVFFVCAHIILSSKKQSHYESALLRVKSLLLHDNESLNLQVL